MDIENVILAKVRDEEENNSDTYLNLIVSAGLIFYGKDYNGKYISAKTCSLSSSFLF